MDAGHAWVAHVCWEAHLAIAGAAEELAEELVEVSEETAVTVQLGTLLFRAGAVLTTDSNWHCSQPCCS